ncbi:MAG: ECF transporter S component [Peptoniphilus sp.]|nr:ECF transporter S component [Peptoniphilus sp.]
MNKVNSKSKINVKFFTRIAMLGAIAFVLMAIQVPLPFIAPAFLQMDISDLPIVIGSFAMGPISAILISALKNILHIVIKGTTTGGVGELSNFIIGSTFAVTAGLIYNRNKTYKTAVIGLLAGTIAMTVISIISNYFFVFPLYSKLIPMEAIINMGSQVTSKITDLWSMMIYSILPFNLIKGFTVSAIAMLIYKRVSPIFKD